MLKDLQCTIGWFQTQAAICKFSDVRESFTAKRKDRLLSFLMLNAIEAKVFRYVVLEGHNVWENNRYWSSTQRNVVAIMVAFECRCVFSCRPEFLATKDKNFSRSGDHIGRNFEPFSNVSNQILWMGNNLVLVKCSDIMSDHVKLAGHIQNLVGQCPMTDCYFQPCLLFVTFVYLPFPFNFRSLNLSLFHKWFWRVLYALLRGGIFSTVELFGCALAFFLVVKGMLSRLSTVIYMSLHRDWQLACADNFFRFISVLQNMF